MTPENDVRLQESSRGQRDPLIVACLVPSAGSSCDWGGCDLGGAGFAWSVEHGWLPACAFHLGTAALEGHPTVVDHLAVREPA